MNDVQIVVTGYRLVGGGIRGFESVLEELISGAGKEIQVVSYVITGGASRVLSMLREAAGRGVRVTVIVNSLPELEASVRELLRAAMDDFPDLFRVLSFRDAREGDIHAKVVVVDRRRALVGSANLSWGGIAGNYEIGVLLEGEPAWQLAIVVDRLVSISSPGC